MIFKKLFNQALIIWDHCVYVRERLLWYDTEKAMPFLVRDTLARLHRAAAEVLYAEADLVTPCCATFNVNWEQWLGHAPETIMPVVNGLDFNQVHNTKLCMLATHTGYVSRRHCQQVSAIVLFCSTLCFLFSLILQMCCILCSSYVPSADPVCVMSQYKTVERVLADRPTVVMMAHINPLKDIVTAIRAAKIIVEEYKVTGMVLHCYLRSAYVHGCMLWCHQQFDLFISHVKFTHITKFP